MKHKETLEIRIFKSFPDKLKEQSLTPDGYTCHHNNTGFLLDQS